MNDIKIQEGQIRQIFASVVLSHKIHETHANICKRKFRLMETLKIISLALTTSLAITIIFVNFFILKICLVSLSLVSLFMTIYCVTRDLKIKASVFKKTSMSLYELREQLVSTLSDIKCDKLSYDDIISMKTNFYDEYFLICKNALDVDEKIVKRVSLKLKEQLDSSYTDQEIDSFLPIALRSNFYEIINEVKVREKPSILPLDNDTISSEVEIEAQSKESKAVKVKKTKETTSAKVISDEILEKAMKKNTINDETSAVLEKIRKDVAKRL